MSRILKSVAVIGATGSVGSSVLDVCRNHRDKLRVVSLAAAKDAEKLGRLSEEFGAGKLCLAERDAAKRLRYPEQALIGAAGLKELVQDPDVDHVVFASSGTAAIEALQTALKAGKEVSLANKESIVVGGAWVMPLVQGRDQLRPLDSEHNAIWQCLHAESSPPRKIYLTASGGPFRGWSLEDMRKVTPEMALKHPVWDMGAKITIDSATLMNKGIELIEAMFLFDLAPGRVEALVSPGSFVHGLVELEDGCVKMLAGEPDMRLPASSCLFWPERLSPNAAFPRPVLVGKTVSFDPVDEARFPALRLAKEAMIKGGAYPALLVGADEAAVDRFLKRDIPFTAIPEAVEETMASWSGPPPRSLSEALDVLEWGRTRCDAICDAKAR
ncbi:MAG: 1-deoxy-D-xylulose-5-phosphate reductoisomerase [Synergistaceae bacterium]|nr:1-deoxy-D-xylulose-5-phosphate reductoisomerase [Synergistaceae bacterium]